MLHQRTFEDDLAKLVFATQRIPHADYPGGWPGQIESALIDAVLSIRAVYGSPTSGVRASVGRYRSYREGASLDNLAVLARVEPDELAVVLGNHQLTAGRMKASAIVEAAEQLVDVGVRHSAHLDPASKAQRLAYMSVRGLGKVTWAYLGMCLGRPGVKADTWVIRFVSRSLGRGVTADVAAELVLRAADSLGVDATVLDHTIWRYMRSSARETNESLAAGEPSPRCGDVKEEKV